MVDGIRKSLRFQADACMGSVSYSTAALGIPEHVSGIALYAGLVCVRVKDDTA